MKRLLLTILLLAAACGSENVTTPTTTERDSVQPPIVESASTVDLIRAADPSFEVVSDYLLMDLVGSICESFDLGLDPTAVHESSYGTGVTMAQVNAMIVASITVTCPEHYAMVEAWSEGGTL